jgi:hypothetical protein
MFNHPKRKPALTKFDRMLHNPEAPEPAHKAQPQPHNFKIPSFLKP